jgi:hypothetical protein
MAIVIGPGIEIGGGITMTSPLYNSLAGSLLFNGSTQYLTTVPGMTLGAGAFTIEGWFYNTGNFSQRPMIGTDQSLGLSAYISDNATMSMDRYGGGYGPFYGFPAATFKTNEWQYIVLNRNASLLETMWVGTFVDNSTVVTCSRATTCGGGTGVSGGTQTESQNWGNTNWIGAFYGGKWAGNITNYRVTIGTAVYNSSSSTITAPVAPLTSGANTKYLMLGAAVTTDTSGTQTVTNVGTVTQTATKPF